MIRKLTFIAGSALFATSLLAETPKPAAAPVAAPASFLQVQDGDTVVFLGDSITHQCIYTQYIEDFFYTRYPERRIHFHNAGISGDKAGDAITRFEEDVVVEEPDFVTILLGMNDGEYSPFTPEIFETYATGMKTVLEKVKATGAETIALSPTMFDHHQLALRKKDSDFRFGNREFDGNYNSLMAYYGAWLRETSSAQGVPFVNLWGPLNDTTFAARRSQPDFSLVEDSIHPGAAGQFVMAFSVLSASQPERRTVSGIALTKNAKGAWVGSKNEKITDITGNDEGTELSFTHLAKALPWVVPAESSNYNLKWGESTPAQVGYDLTKAGHKLSNEKLRISGLAPGSYELTIDDVVIGTFSHTALSIKLELQNYSETPQYQQSLKVAELNRTRNDEAVRPSRDLQARIKGLRRNKEDADFESHYKEIRAKIEALHGKAAEHEEKIYAAAQPVPRHYRLRKVK
ncbi:SGNH/GDSL hydrolase family protein [Verrucomicrobiales bacterium BCK34]|nr:SGNH/GDSL hydrolase family protein [Verrucomicrobiales bacterium BCK34]